LPPAAKSPQAVEELEVRAGGPGGEQARTMRQWLDERPNRRVGVGGAIELIGKAAVLGCEHDARRRDQQRTRLRGDEVGPENEHMARLSLDSRRRPRLAGADQGLDRHLEILHIRRPALVQDHEIDGELLHSPVFVRLQNLMNEIEILDVGYSQQDDGQIARNPMRPQFGLRAGALTNRVRGGPQGSPRENDVAGQALKQTCLSWPDAQMMKLNLALGPGQVVARS
jgi:hypothetical protein